MACAATQGLDDIQTQDDAKDHIQVHGPTELEPLLMSMVHVATKGYKDAWLVVMLKDKGHATAGVMLI